MRIVCPTCAAAYDVPDSLLTAGRTVRCARCTDEWTPVASAPPAMDGPPPPAATATPADASAMAAGPEIDDTETPRARSTAQLGPTAMDRLASNPALPPARYGLRVAWAASIAFLMLLACGAYVWRSEIIRAWPPSVRMYAAFGLHADTNQTR